MQKLQEEISLKSGYVKELKILFEETKKELIKTANESYNKAKIDLERELKSSSNVSNALNFNPEKMPINNNTKNANKNSIKNLVSTNSKSKMNVKAGKHLKRLFEILKNKIFYFIYNFFIINRRGKRKKKLQ
jgi:hypothetical protein